MALTSIYQGPDEYLLAYLAKLQALGSKVTDFNTMSAARSIAEAICLLLAAQSLTADQLRRDSFLQTAEGDALDTKADDWETVRVAATQATGVVRLTRLATGTAVTVAVGLTLQTKPSPGQAPVAVATTQDAVFGTGDLSIDVTAQASVGGTAGNLADQTVLLPINPIAGFQTDGGFKAQGAFTNGTDAQTDDQLRTLVRKRIQGRTRGKKEAFEAAVLGVPGVTAVAVLEPGDTDPGGGTVAAGTIKIWYEGSAGLLTQVTSEAQGARVLCQNNIVIAAATAENLTVEITVYVVPGTDHAVTAAIVKPAIQAYVRSVGPLGTVYQATGIRTMDALDGVISVALPMTDFRKTSGVDNTSVDVPIAANKYADLPDANLAITVVDLP